MDDENYRKIFGALLRQQRRDVKHWTQDKLERAMRQKGIIIRQETISKLEKGVSNLYPDAQTIRAVADCCGVPKGAAEIYLQNLQSECAKKVRRKKPLKFEFEGGSSLIMNGDSQWYEAYHGEYYCYFHSTNSQDAKIVYGKMVLSKAEHLCRASVTINSKGPRSKPIKTYEGVFLINTHYQVWYCILVGKSRQEFCMMVSNHIKPTVENNTFNIALVITTSAGSTKRPTMHRMIFSRKQIPKQKLELMQSQLRLNSDQLLIQEDALDRLDKAMEQKLQSESLSREQREEYESVRNAIKVVRKSGQRKVYYSLSESVLMDDRTIHDNQKQRSRAVAHIRSESDTPYNNKVSDTVQRICLDIIDK